MNGQPSPERGVYFDAWFPGHHCYHPSLPARRLRMVEHLVDFHATVLVWSALGGGSISLPYLEQEAFGEIDPRFRFYGFVNDVEFIAECDKRGIKAIIRIQIDLNRRYAKADLIAEPQVRIDHRSDLMLNIQRVDNGAALHIIRYDRDADDRSTALPELTVDLRLPVPLSKLSLHAPNGTMSGELALDGDWHRLTLRDVPLYGIALLGAE